MYWMQTIKQLVCVRIILTLEVVDTQIVSEGVVEATSHLEIDQFVNFVANMVMMWLIVSIFFMSNSLLIELRQRPNTLLIFL